MEAEEQPSPDDVAEPAPDNPNASSDSRMVQIGMVLNDLSDDLEFPVDMGNGWSLDRATPEEVAHIKREFNSIGQIAKGGGSRNFHYLPYESKPHIQESGALWRDYSPNPSDWRYTVIRLLSESMTDFWKVVEALRISEAGIRIGGWIGFTPGQTQYQTTINYIESIHYLDWIHARWLPQTPDLAHVREVAALRWQLDDNRFPSIAKAMKLFLQLDQMADNYDAKLLGHFAVLESLLSHQPNPNDPVDSISRQLKRNLILLDHRMPQGQGLGLSAFKEASAEQVIGKLYSVRSAAAHGGDNKTALEWLNKRKPEDWGLMDTIQQFVMKITARVLVAALKEPQLVTDLTG
ncbi:hypothetical protein [Nocardia sp. NPDC047654]|uniref:hypothetical protein n=1 Tax=Nocardia sp. NPDC047654 TaxID=3364314 RepID=UPI003715D5CB